MSRETHDLNDDDDEYDPDKDKSETDDLPELELDPEDDKWKIKNDD